MEAAEARELERLLADLAPDAWGLAAAAMSEVAPHRWHLSDLAALTREDLSLGTGEGIHADGLRWHGAIDGAALATAHVGRWLTHAHRSATVRQVDRAAE